jgi:hypothetical protein
MPVSLEFLRGLLGGLSIFFAHFFGRAVVKVSKGKERKRALYTWGLRSVLTIAAVCYRGVDRLAIVILALDAIAFGLGWWDEWRPKHEEDLTRTIFPEDP